MDTPCGSAQSLAKTSLLKFLNWLISMEYRTYKIFASMHWSASFVYTIRLFHGFKKKTCVLRYQTFMIVRLWNRSAFKDYPKKNFFFFGLFVYVNFVQIMDQYDKLAHTPELANLGPTCLRSYLLRSAKQTKKGTKRSLRVIRLLNNVSKIELKLS